MPEIGLYLADVQAYRIHPCQCTRRYFPFHLPHNVTQCTCSNSSHFRPTALKTSKYSYSVVVQPLSPTYILLCFQCLTKLICMITQFQPLATADGRDRQGLDLDELPPHLTGLAIPSAFTLSDAPSDALSRLNPQLSPSMSLKIQLLPTSLLTYLQPTTSHHPLSLRSKELSLLYHPTAIPSLVTFLVLA